jgi:hypothetical protein
LCGGGGTTPNFGGRNANFDGRGEEYSSHENFLFVRFLNHHTRVLRDTSQGLKRFSFFNKMMFILCCVLAVFSSDEADFPFLLTLSRQVWRLDLASSHLETMTS